MSARSPPGSSSMSPTRAFRRHRSSTTTTSATMGTPISSKHLTAETVAALPPPGLSGPMSFVFSPATTVPSSSPDASWSRMVQDGTCTGRYLSFLTSHLPTQPTLQQKQVMTGERRLCVVDMGPFYQALLRLEEEETELGSLLEPGAREEYYFDATNNTNNHHVTGNNVNDASFTTAASSSPEKTGQNKNNGSTTVASIPYSNPLDLYSHSHVTCLLSSHQSSQLPSYHPPTPPPAAAATVTGLSSGSDLFQTPSGESAGSLASLSLLANNHKNNMTPTATAQHSETHNTNINQNNNVMSLEERLRRERQRIHSGGGLTQFTWGTTSTTMLLGNDTHNSGGGGSMGVLRLLVPLRGNVYLQDGVASEGGQMKLVYDKRMLATTILRNRSRPSSSHFIPTTTTTKPGNKRHRHGRKSRRRRRHHHTMTNTVERHDSNVSGRSSGGSSTQQQQQQQQPSTLTVDDGSGSAVGRDSGAIDAQLSPDGTMVAFVVAGEIFVSKCPPPDNGPANYWNENGDIHHMNYDMRAEDGDNSALPLYSLPVRLTYGALPDDWIVENQDDASLSSDSAESSWDDTMEGETDGEAAAAAMESSTYFEQEQCVTHGLADFVAQEEMDRYRGFWWDPSSTGILFAKVDESMVPAYRITHQGRDGLATDESTYEDHRYPFAGASNPSVRLGYVSIDRPTILGHDGTGSNPTEATRATEPELDESFDLDMDDPRGPNNKGHSTSRSMNNGSHHSSSHNNNDLSAVIAARKNWSNVQWFNAPPAASEYLARACWLPDGTACAQWQNREQSTLLLVRMDVCTGQTMTLLGEQRDSAWINLHHMLRLLPRAIHPDECFPMLEDLHPHIPSESLPDGSFSFLFASERTGFQHLYLYTYLPGNSQATLIRTVSAGDWMVESIAGVDVDNDTVYVTGTFDSPLERHLYALPLTNHRGGAGVEQYDNSRYIPVSSQHVGPPQGGDIVNGGSSSGGGVRRGLKQVINVISGGGIKSRHSQHSSSASKSHGDSVPLLETSRTRSSSIVDPVRLTTDPGMHNVVLDDECRAFVDTSSDIGRPTSVKVFALPFGGPLAPHNTSNPSNHHGKIVDQTTHGIQLLFVLYDATFDDKKMATGTTSSFGSPRNFDMASSPRTAAAAALNQTKLPPPELLSFPTSDGTETLHAALYKPDPRVHGPGPYPLICAVYGGPHVQRVNRSWSQCADMRAQRLCSLGFAVVKCDNRGSSRRGLAFESSIRHRLGRLEVLDQVTAVRHLTSRGIADSNRVGIYGWSYGGYLSAMCLCRAPDVFHVAVAGAPVTSWDGYDTHYTERYMGLPSENVNGYRESAVFEHVPNMRGKLMIVHGLIDENVHFRHSARLINRLIASSKDYDLLIFPEERHSPRRLRDRIYMEQRISDYFIKNLLSVNSASSGNNSYGRTHTGGGPYQQREVMPGRL